MKKEYQDLLDEANRRYPIGTMYNAITKDGRDGYENEKVRYPARFVNKPENSTSIEVGRGYVYSDNNKRWAESLAPKPEVTNNYQIF